MERREIQFLVILFTIIFIVLVGSIFGLINYVMRKRIEFIRKQEKIKAQHEEAILNTKIEITEQQYQTISQELHDNVGQLLSVASLELDMLNRTKPMKELMEIHQLVKNSLIEIRSISKGMNSQLIAESNLYDMIKTECDRINRLKLCKAHVSQSGEVKMSANQKVVIFRIVQEFLTNSLKHSEANNIKIDICKSGTDTTVCISDDGKGFDTDQTQISNGLVNMKNRATLIGAEYTFFSAPNMGCKLTLKLSEEL